MRNFGAARAAAGGVCSLAPLSTSPCMISSRLGAPCTACPLAERHRGVTTRTLGAAERNQSINQSVAERHRGMTTRGAAEHNESINQSIQSISQPVGQSTNHAAPAARRAGNRQRAQHASQRMGSEVERKRTHLAVCVVFVHMCGSPRRVRSSSTCAALLVCEVRFLVLPLSLWRWLQMITWKWPN